MKFFAVLTVLLCSVASFARPVVTDTIASKVYVLESTENNSAGKPVTKTLFSGSGAVLGRQQMEVHTITRSGSATRTPGATGELFFIVKKGMLTFTLNGETKTMGRGSVVLVLPGDALKIDNATSTDAEFYEMSYHTKGAADHERAKAAGPSFMMDWKDMVFKPHDKGGVRQLFDRRTAMFNRFDIHVTQLNEGYNSHAPHQHRNEEIILMLEGNAEMVIGNTRQKANPGDVVYLSSNISHNLTNVGKNACLYFAIQWN